MKGKKLFTLLLALALAFSLAAGSVPARAEELPAGETPIFEDPAGEDPAPQDPAPQDPAPQDPAPQDPADEPVVDLQPDVVPAFEAAGDFEAQGDGDTTYTLTVNDGSAGTVTLDPAEGPYAAGAQVTLTAEMDEGYAFQKWVVTNADDAEDSFESTDNPLTLTMDKNYEAELVFDTVWTVTYKVVNGTWADGSTADIPIEVVDGDTVTVVPEGMKANQGFTGGAWDAVPTAAPITENKTFTYTVEPQMWTVTYKVKNGTWSDGKTADVTEKVQDGQKPAKVPTGMKAKEGYAGGSWDADPAAAAVTINVTYTYSFEPVTYTVTEGGNGNWTKGSGKTYQITVKRGPDDENCFSHFKSVQIDGKTLGTSEYTAAKGSTVITLKAATLQALTTTSHTVNVIFDDGAAAAKLTVKPDPRSPSTGDGRHTGLWAALTAGSALGMAGIAMVTLKRRKGEK